MVEQSERNAAVTKYFLEEAGWAAWNIDGDGYIEMVELDSGFAG